ncbi:HamA C-terminal domain-containing protein [Enterococcus sp.]|uniref:HamA C-terminal domain-containing protein n=1 Tax=Enterococcus sp. TaxID=35783 RepID=UPI002FCC08CE
MGKLTDLHRYDDIQSHCFHIVFDLDDQNEIYQNIEGWCEEVFDEIPNFALGKAKAQEISYDSPRKAVRQAMKLMYNIKEIQEASSEYLVGEKKNDSEDKYLRRGEFGELILYYLLVKKFNKPQLISKLYFKDSFNAVVHGFDAVHFDPETKQLWLGESKFYKNKNSALNELAKDLTEHFNVKFFNQEFTIIKSRFKDLGIKDTEIENLIDPETKFLSKLVNINACFFALFDSKILETFSYNDGTDTISQEFLDKLKISVEQTRESFKEKIKDFKNTENLKIHLFLFPVQSKHQLVKKLHKKLKKEQS